MIENTSVAVQGHEEQIFIFLTTVCKVRHIGDIFLHWKFLSFFKIDLSFGASNPA